VLVGNHDHVPTVSQDGKPGRLGVWRELLQRREYDPACRSIDQTAKVAAILGLHRRLP